MNRLRIVGIGLIVLGVAALLAVFIAFPQASSNGLLSNKGFRVFGVGAIFGLFGVSALALSFCRIAAPLASEAERS